MLFRSFLNHHAVKFQEHLAMANRATLAVQMGHGETTHNLYAGDARLPSGIDFHLFFRSMKTSGIWHELLGFPPTLSQDMNATSSHHSPSRLSDLRNFLNNPDARFKTSQQAEVSEAIAVGEPSLLVIGPTGLFSRLAIPFLRPDVTISQALERRYQLCSI